MTLSDNTFQPEEKRRYVRVMFGRIARTYDILNHVLTAGVDIYWRRKAVEALGELPREPIIIDVATGTGDLGLEALRQYPDAYIYGVDVTPEMLEIFKRKFISKRGEAVLSDAENMHQFTDNRFDAALCGFGIRNFGNLAQGFREIARILKPGAPFVALEITRPTGFLFSRMYNFYFERLLPRIGKMISSNDEAYRYLPASVARFPDSREVLRMMEHVGFTGVSATPLSLGIVTIFRGSKK